MKLDLSFEQNQQNINVPFSESGGQFSANFGETSVLHDGQNGATFIPSVSADGIISWTNDRGLQNPPPVNIKGEKGDKGEQGERGLQGVQGERGADGAKGDKGDRGEQGIQGIKGAKGDKGDAFTYEDFTPEQLASLKGEKGDTGVAGKNGEDGYTPVKGVDYFDGVNGKDGKDGADGYTPVRGVDYYTEADKTEIVLAVIDNLGGVPLFGYVDENNNVVLKGNLADGEYNIKYEMTDGSKVNIGDLVLDTNTYYTITSNLTNCTISNSATEVVEGGSYSATITANSGYELKSVSVTMGGSAVSVSGGVVNITSVTGDIVITAVAEESDVEITNWIEEVGYTTDTRLSLSSGGTKTASGYECTGFIEAKYGDVLYIENVDLADENATNIIFYDKEKNPVAVDTAGTQYGTKLYYLFTKKGTQTGAGYSTTIVAEGYIEALPTTVEFIRIGSKSITSESVLNIKRDGTWL